MMIANPLVVVVSALCLSSTVSALVPSDIPSDTPVSQLLSSASTNLAQGNAQDALVYFDAAILRDPSDYLTIFKRGAAYLSLGRNVQASRDFDQVLKLKPDFEGALTQRAKIKQRSGDWAGARSDYEAAKKKAGPEMEALDEAQAAAKLAFDAEQKSEWEACITQAGAAIFVASTSLELRQRRARCRFEKGEVVEGMADLNHVLQISPASIEPSLRIAAMSFYSIAEPEKGIVAISKCLQNDPDNKECSKLRKSLKSIDRRLKKVQQHFEKRQFATGVRSLVPQGDDEPGLMQDVKDDVQTYRDLGYIHPRAGDQLYGRMVELTCEAYMEMNNKPKAQNYCDETRKYFPSSLPAYIAQARRQVDADEFEAALNTMKEAQDTHGNHERIVELQQKAQTLLKRSKQKDYYKVLGVTRDADEREIKRAFRRLTIQYHPDKAAKNGISQDEAQKKMSAINEAYEVLSDPELKERFDRGDDPNDPTAGQQPFQGSPFGFGAGGQPIFFQQSGGGGGASFKFQAGGGFPGGFPGGFNF